MGSFGRGFGGSGIGDGAVVAGPTVTVGWNGLEPTQVMPVDCVTEVWISTGATITRVPNVTDWTAL